MSRTKAEISLHQKLAQACDKVGAVPKKGKNSKYDYQRYADVAEALRHELFSRGILIIGNELKPELRDIPTNGGSPLQECILCVEYEITDGRPAEAIKRQGWGIARDSEDKALYKAKTGALKYFLRGLGLIPDETDDPEFERDYDGETPEDDALRRIPKKEQSLAAYQIRAVNEALAVSGKTEIDLLSRFHVTKISDMKRKDFKDLLAWASDGKGTLAAPKTQPSQSQLHLPTAPRTTELKFGNKTVEIPAEKHPYAL